MVIGSKSKHDIHVAERKVGVDQTYLVTQP
jgi:hypothetical protein